MKKSLFIILGSVFTISFVYAINSVIVNIPGGQISYFPSGYMEQKVITLDGAMTFINKDNDENIIGDLFIGDYYDSAYGVFNFANTGTNSVKVSNQTSNDCLSPTTHSGYILEGYSYSPDFGLMNFYDTSSSNYVYLCVPKDPLDSSLTSYLGGYAYSDTIGLQNFNGIQFDASVDTIIGDGGGGDHLADGRYVKVDGVTSSHSYEKIDIEFENDVRILGDITKSTLKKQLQKNIYNIIRNITPDNITGSENVSSVGLNTWNTLGGGKLLSNENILYFGNLGDNIVTVSGSDNIEGNKTLIVEGGNIYITGNIRNTDNDGAILGMVAIQKDGQGGNIYIDPEVTDIHAIMYADRALLNYDGTQVLSSTTLENQLYIKGSIFSENTIGGAISLICPYFENTSCTQSTALKYDFNHFRNYILVLEIDAGGISTGNYTPQFGGKESYMGDEDTTNTEAQRAGYRKYPFIIEYDPRVQENPPPLF